MRHGWDRFQASFWNMDVFFISRQAMASIQNSLSAMIEGIPMYLRTSERSPSIPSHINFGQFIWETLVGNVTGGTF